MNIREKCLILATCGNLGNFRFGGIIASLLAFPVIFGMKGLYWFDPHIASIVATGLVFLVLVIVHVALNTIAEQDASAIVIDRIVGLSIAFMYVPLSANPAKFIGVGFIFFHMLYHLFPTIMTNAWHLNISSLPTLLSVSSPSILAGMSVQLFFRLMIWIVH